MPNTKLCGVLNSDGEMDAVYCMGNQAVVCEYRTEVDNAFNGKLNTVNLFFNMA